MGRKKSYELSGANVEKPSDDHKKDTKGLTEFFQLKKYNDSFMLLISVEVVEKPMASTLSIPSPEMKRNKRNCTLMTIWILITAILVVLIIWLATTQPNKKYSQL